MFEITQQILKTLLKYNPHTGLFTRNITRGNSKSGTIAGTLTNDGYIRITINGQRYLAHRLAWLYMKGSFPPYQIDHENRIRDDNRWVNLRKATNLENQHNSINNNKVIGVRWHKNNKRYMAFGTSIGRNQNYISSHVQYWDAICTRKSWENNNLIIDNTK